MEQVINSLLAGNFDINKYVSYLNESVPNIDGLVSNINKSVSNIDKSVSKHLMIFGHKRVITSTQCYEAYSKYNSKLYSYSGDYDDITLAGLLVSNHKYSAVIEFVLKEWELFSNSRQELINEFLCEFVDREYLGSNMYKYISSYMLKIFKPYHSEVLEFLNYVINFEDPFEDLSPILDLLEQHNYDKEFNITPDFLYAVALYCDDSKIFIDYYTEYIRKVSDFKFSLNPITCTIIRRNPKLADCIMDNCEDSVSSDILLNLLFHYTFPTIESLKRFFPINEYELGRWLACAYWDSWILLDNINILRKVIKINDEFLPFNFGLFLEGYDDREIPSSVSELDLLLSKDVHIYTCKDSDEYNFLVKSALSYDNIFDTKDKVKSWKVNFMVHLNVRNNFSKLKKR